MDDDTRKVTASIDLEVEVYVDTEDAESEEEIAKAARNQMRNTAERELINSPKQTIKLDGVDE